MSDRAREKSREKDTIREGKLNNRDGDSEVGGRETKRERRERQGEKRGYEREKRERE